MCDKFGSLIFAVMVLSILGCNNKQTDVGLNVEDNSKIDITNAILTETSSNCQEYIQDYFSVVKDIKRSISFEGSVLVSNGDTGCTITVNGIPNHDFNDQSAQFAHDVSEVNRIFNIPDSPVISNQSTPLSQTYYDAIMLNGVVLDMLSAGCYRPTDSRADSNGNVQIGCNANAAWLIDPLGSETKFGADAHNAHTQPDGTYHYHGNPLALFDDNPGLNGSPVIGFAADGFPIFGSYFLDPATNQIRKAISGYTLKVGSRPGPDDQNPGGEYDGMYNDDYEFTDAGDLDRCNGMVLDGTYGYYVTDNYPWVLKCHVGTPHTSFSKASMKVKLKEDFWHHAH